MNRYIICAISALLCTLTTSCSKNTAEAEVVKEGYIHKYGVKVTKDEWDSRGSDGQLVQVIDTGETVVRNYEHGSPEGDQTWTFPHTKTIAKRESWANNKLERTTTYFDSGMPAEEDRLLDNGNTLKTTWYHGAAPKSMEEWEGKKLVKGEYYNSSNELQNQVDDGKGTRVVYDPYGQLLSKDTFEDGYLTSTTSFHRNGSPKEYVAYQDNQTKGLRRTFNPDGSPLAVEDWQNGQQHGLSVTYRNGQKWSEVTYANGLKQGVEIVYNGQALPVGQRFWDKGKLHGPAQSFVGNTANTRYFLRGREVSKITFDKAMGGT